MNLKEKITEAAEKIYDLSRENKYAVKIGKESKVISIRNTAHTKKWRAKNR